MPRPVNRYKSINAYVPIQLGNIEEITAGTNLQPDRIRAIYHQFFLKRLADSTDDKVIETDKFKAGWVSLHTSLLKKVATNEYVRYLDFLEQKGLIIKRRDAITGGKKYAKNTASQQYKIPEHLLHNAAGTYHFRKEKITDHCTLKSIDTLKESYRKSIKTSEIESIHLQLKEMLKEIRFDIKSAELFLEKVKNGEIIFKKNPEKAATRNYREILLLMDAINEGHYERSTVDLFGKRFHTPITNLWKELRRFIYFADFPSEKIVTHDFSNSQPYFSSIAINSNLIEKIIPEFLNAIDGLDGFTESADFKQYAELCANGEIYGYWQDRRGLPKTDEGKDIAKGEIFTIMFDKKRKLRNIKTGDYKDFYDMLRLFYSCFPSVYTCFYRIKSLDEGKLPFIKDVFVNCYGVFEGKKSYHKILACMMQRMESTIMLHRIVPKLIDAGLTPFVTVHDSVMLPAKFKEQSEEIIKNEFEKLGVTPPNIKHED